MKKFNTVYTIFFLIFTGAMFFNFSSNPPNGRTGAPGEGTCSGCHGQNPGFNGTLTINGLPSTIQPNTNYSITVTVAATMGTPSRAGFQLVALDGNDQNVGTLTPMGSTTTQSSGGRTYVEHNPAQTMTGGTVNYMFDWNSPSTAGGNQVTMYSAALMGNGSGSGNDKTLLTTASGTLMGANPPTATITGSINVSCNGGNDGSATAQGAGGAPPYQYDWSSGASGTTASNLSAGIHIVTVTDDNGLTGTDQVTITEPSILDVTISNQVNIDCNNAAGQATAAGNGGMGGYSYSWSNGESGATAFNLPAGMSDVTVTDGNNCMDFTSVNILENLTIPVAEAGVDMTITCTSSMVTLDGTGSSTGANFSYLWTTVFGTILSGQNTLNPVVNDEGIYTLVVTDNTNGCTATDDTEVFLDNTSPIAAAGPDKTIDCNNPQVTLDATGSSSGTNISYLWTTLDGNIVSGATTAQPIVNMEGTYTIRVTNNATGCEATDDVEVVSNTGNITAEAGTNGILTCSQTQIQLDGTGSSVGTGITYLWTTTSGNIISGATTLTPTVDATGQYTLTVSDASSGCIAVDMVDVSGDFVSPISNAGPDMELTCASSLVTLDGSASSVGIDFIYQWTALSGNIVSGTATLSPIVDSVGIYELTVTDLVNGCTAVDSATVSLDTVAPIISAGPDGELNCNTDTVLLQGTGPSGSQFAVNWTTISGNIVTGGSSYSPTVDSPGRYFLIVADMNNGCTSSDAAEVIEISNPIAGLANITGVTCFGDMDGTANVTVNLGESPYSYVWSSGATDSTANNLSGGAASVTVTDNNGCTASANFTVPEPSIIMSNGGATAETANGSNDGTAFVNPSGGTPGYTYMWSTGAGTDTIIGLSPATYFVTVSDINGCQAIDSFTVNSFNCNLTGTFSGTPTACFGGSDGTADANISGGIMPYAYNWSTGDTISTVSGLSAGTVSVTVTDASGCEVIGSVMVSEPPELMITVAKNDATCFAGNDGSITPTVSGGTLPYSFAWSNGDTTAMISNLSSGIYQPTIVDANGCQLVGSEITISEPADIVIILTPTGETANMANDGTVSSMISGGTPGYTYAWSTGADSIDIFGLSPGNYSLTVTDVNGCQKSDTATIQSFNCAGITADVDISNTYICPKSMSGSLILNGLSGGMAPYTFSWSTGSNNDTIRDLSAGVYTLSATDASGCEFTQDYLVTEEDTIAPILNTQTLTIVLDSFGNGSFVPADIDNGSTDNCGGIDSVYVDINTFSCDDIGNNTVQVVVFDENGNCSDGPETVTVVDQTAPVVTCPDDIVTLDCSSVSYSPVVANDNCDSDVDILLEEGLASGSVFPVGTTTVTYSATDDSDNVSTCSFDVTVNTDLRTNVGNITMNCNGTAEVTVQITGGAAPFIYSWNTGSMNSSSIVTDSFSVTITDATGCVAVKDSIISPPDILELAVDSIRNEIQGTENGAAFISVSGGTVPYMYEWSDVMNTVISNSEDLVNVSAGAYNLLVTDGNGCSDTLSVMIETTVSAFNPELTRFIQLFPNPAGDRFQLDLDLPFGEKVEIRFYNLSGEIIDRTDPIFLQKSRLTFESRHWPAGVYLIKIFVGKEVLVKRLIVE